MNTSSVSDSYESMLYEDTPFIRPLHIGLRSKLADSMYISHRAQELYRMAQRRKRAERSPTASSGVQSHAGLLSQEYQTSEDIMSIPQSVARSLPSSQARASHTSPRLSLHTPPPAPPEKNAQKKPLKRRVGQMWQVPSWLAALYPMYAGEHNGKGAITVQGILFEHNAAWDAYLSAVGTHYRNTLVTHNIKGIEGHYDALIEDEDKSAAVKDDFYRRINADKKLQKIMKSLGIRLPT